MIQKRRDRAEQFRFEFSETGDDKEPNKFIAMVFPSEQTARLWLEETVRDRKQLNQRRIRQIAGLTLIAAIITIIITFMVD